MLISKAFAAADAATNGATTTAMTQAPMAGTSPKDAFLLNMGLVVVMVAFFYLLIIRPQQKRLQQHTDMLSKLEKGEKIIVSGGLVGTIDRVVDDREMIIDLGNSVKVTVLRSAVSSKYADIKPANDDKKTKGTVSK